jgi:hypothetical protein
MKNGGFNSRLHIGEDLELELRMRKMNKKWLRVQDAKAYHPLSVPEYLRRPKENVCGWNLLMGYSQRKYRFLMKRFVSIWTMPIYYFFKTFDLRVFGCYFVYKLMSMLYYLSGKYDV